jgi:hypothetical protein
MVHIERFDPRGGRPQRTERPQGFAPRGGAQGGPNKKFGGPRPQGRFEGGQFDGEGAPRPYAAPKFAKKKFPGKSAPRVNPS